MPTLKALQGSTAEMRWDGMGDTVKPTTNKKPLLKKKKKTHHIWLVPLEGMCETLKQSGRKFSGLRPKIELVCGVGDDSIMLWGCSTAAGLESMGKIVGKTNEAKYSKT